ncbi:MAG: LexA family transcriptional regulator [Deltaproteobacteria bacterium]|nr:LexA family transcriptional regulator [Candidatus Zymogenaceae bacterium]
MNIKTLSDILLDYKQKTQMTYEQLGKKAQTSPQTIYDIIENNNIPQLTTIQRIIKKLDLDPKEIYGAMYKSSLLIETFKEIAKDEELPKTVKRDVGKMIQKIRGVKWIDHLGRISGNLNGLTLENGVFDHNTDARTTQYPFQTDHQEVIAATMDDDSMAPIVKRNDTVFITPFDGTLEANSVYLIHHDDTFLIRSFTNRSDDLLIFAPADIANFPIITSPESDIEILGRLVFSTRSHE